MLEVWRLYRKRRKIIAKADRDSMAARKTSDNQMVLTIAADSYLECEHIDERITRFLDAEIRQEAQELDIAFPPIEQAEMWHHDADQSLLLTFRGRSYLRERIDKEKMRRFEVKTLWVTKFWIPLLAASIGIIGALTGMFAVLQHKK
jgi:hypothetical protein